MLTTRALVLLVCAIGCGLLALHAPKWGAAIGMSVAVLALLDRLIRD